MKKIALWSVLLLSLGQPLWADYSLNKPEFKEGLEKNIDVGVKQLPAQLDSATHPLLRRASVLMGYWISGKLYEQSYPLDLKTMHVQIPAKTLVPWIKTKQPANWTGIDFIRSVGVDAEYSASDPKQIEHLKLTYEWPHDPARIKTLSLPFVKMINPSGYTLVVQKNPA